MESLLEDFTDTEDYGIYYTSKTFRSSLQNVGRSADYFSSKRHRDVDTDSVSCLDADFTDSVDGRRSASNYVFFLCGGPIRR